MNKEYKIPTMFKSCGYCVYKTNKGYASGNCLRYGKSCDEARQDENLCGIDSKNFSMDNEYIRMFGFKKIGLLEKIANIFRGA